MSNQICVSLSELEKNMLNALLEGLEMGNGSRLFHSKSELLGYILREKYEEYVMERARRYCDGTIENFIESCHRLDTVGALEFRNKKFFELWFDK